MTSRDDGNWVGCLTQRQQIVECNVRLAVTVVAVVLRIFSQCACVSWRERSYEVGVGEADEANASSDQNMAVGVLHAFGINAG